MNQRSASCPSDRNYCSQILWGFLLLAQPIMAASSSIGSSSDVWASVVANVAPLLILVGEKHVRAYFKIMCRRSHYLFYAAGPIGLISAITTMIRLSGVRSLKRLIGRQYESRAEVLAAVTSVSTGQVCYEIKDRVLEQTTTPTGWDTAVFHLRGQKDGTAKELHQWLGSPCVQNDLIGSPYQRSVRGGSFQIGTPLLGSSGQILPREMGPEKGTCRCPLLKRMS